MPGMRRLKKNSQHKHRVKKNVYRQQKLPETGVFAVIFVLHRKVGDDVPQADLGAFASADAGESAELHHAAALVVAEATRDEIKNRKAQWYRDDRARIRARRSEYGINRHLMAAGIA